MGCSAGDATQGLALGLEVSEQALALGNMCMGAGETGDNCEVCELQRQGQRLCVGKEEGLVEVTMKFNKIKRKKVIEVRHQSCLLNFAKKKV